MTKATEKATERRNFWRAVFHSPVRLTTHDGQTFAQLLDISLKGFTAGFDAVAKENQPG